MIKGVPGGDGGMLRLYVTTRPLPASLCGGLGKIVPAVAGNLGYPENENRRAAARRLVLGMVGN